MNVPHNTHAEMLILVQSHNFTVTRITPRGRGVIESFARRFIEYTMFRDKYDRFTKTAMKVYAAATADRSEYRFHINQLNDFKLHLASNNLIGELVEIIHLPIPSPVLVEFEIQPQWNDLEHQPPVINYLKDPGPPRLKFVSMQTGKGKMQPLDAKIKVPGGWKTMGEMEIGTAITAPDGSTTLVTGLFPNGEQPIYRITFADGRTTEAGGEHLWKVYYVNSQPHRRWRIVDTVEMQRLISMPNPRVYVQLVESEIGYDIELPMEPYTLGVILGDGGLTSDSISITKNDKEIFEELEKHLPDSLCFSTVNSRTKLIVRKDPSKSRNIYRSILQEMDLMGKKSPEKFIPKQYLDASTAQRLAILQGLMDTDGTVEKNSTTVSFTSTSEQLAKDVQYLVRSLGGIATITQRYPTFSYKGEKKQGLLAHTVFIRHPKPSCLFRLPRKKELTNDNNQYADSLKLRVSKIEYIGHKLAQCISVAHPDRLYVTDDFIVTHNSYTAMRAMADIGMRTLVLVKPMYIEKWIEDMRRTMVMETKDIIVVRGSDQLMALLLMAQTQDLDCKVIIISTKTMQNWLKLYEKFKDGTLTMGYACTPDRHCEVLGIGIKLSDETHQEFHLNFKIDLYTNVFHSFYLSATLVSDDAFKNKMYEIAFPAATRFKGPALDKYIDAYAIFYKFHYPNKIRYKDPSSRNYSHHVFEQCILRSQNTASNYFGLINKILANSYIKDYRPGQKAIIFCASIDMCTAVTSYLSKLYPKLDVRRYVEEDPWENLMDADIRVTTLLSAGTAVDIDNLVVTILTTAVSSSQSNIQGLGRLRKLKDKEVTPRFYYFVCEDVDKQIMYHEKKREMLRDRAKSYQSIFIGERI